MTRKFRVWAKIANSYFPSSLFLLDCLGNLRSCDLGGQIYDGQSFQIESSSGLIDTTGKEIYEGDIIECESPHHGDGLIEEVVFCQGMFMVAGIEYALSDLNFIKVIGNVHENLELLEKENGDEDE